MPNNKKNPTNIDTRYEAKATSELEESIADDLEVEDPEDIEATIAELEISSASVEDEDESEVEEDAPSRPARHRGPK